MALDKLPRPILHDILDQVVQAEDSMLSEILALRLVNRYLDAEIVRTIYDRDSCHLHSRTDSGSKPTGVALQRVVKGFILRSNVVPDVLKEVLRALRDGVLILTVLLGCASEADVVETTSTVRASGSAFTTIPSHGKRSNVWQRSLISEDQDDDDYLPDAAVIPICKAYIDLLEEERAFESLNPTWERDPDRWAKLNDTTGHFWALLAAVCDGRAQIVDAAIKACIDRLANEENTSKLKMYFAAALLIAAKNGKIEIVENIIAQPAMRVNLRLQNTRFAGKNAMEVAIEGNHGDVIRLLLKHGWNFSTVPADLLRSLKATVVSMEISPLRDELLQILLEGDCQQRRSDSIVGGLYVELCKRGDLKTCQKLLSLLEQPGKAEYDWKWTIPDDFNNDHIMSSPAPIDNDDNDFFNFHNAQNDEDSAIYKTVAAKHNHMIPFLFDNHSLFPETMSSNFTAPCVLKCLEYTIINKEQEAFTTLLAKQSDITLAIDPIYQSENPKICLRKLTLFAVCHGNLSAVETLLSYINLNDLIKLNDGFCDTVDNGSSLIDMTCLMEDTESPNAFLSMRYCYQPDNVKLGTFLLVTAIKFLHLPITKLLLSKSCTIGFPIRILSRSLVEVRHARLWLPHDTSTCDDCTATLPVLTQTHNRPLTLLTSSSLPPWSIKRMIETGTPLSDLSTSPRIITPSTQFKSWRWKPLGASLVEMDAKIISAIQIPGDVWSRSQESEMTERLDEMRALMREWRLPDVYLYRESGECRRPRRRHRRRNYN